MKSEDRKMGGCSHGTIYVRAETAKQAVLKCLRRFDLATAVLYLTRPTIFRSTPEFLIWTRSFYEPKPSRKSNKISNKPFGLPFAKEFAIS
jgi:hypothetical protein